MFEKAARLKVRFDTTLGRLSVEELWDLPLTSTTNRTNLDDIACSLYAQLKNGTDVSFVVPDRKSNELIQLKFDLVKHIIDVRLAENAAKTQARNNAEKKQRLLQIIAERTEEDLRGKPLDELRALVDGLD